MQETSNSTLTFNVQLTKSDIRRAIIAYQMRRPINWMLQGLGLLVILAFAADLAFHTFEPGLLFLGLLWCGLPFLPALRTPTAKDEYQPTQYQFDETKLRRTTATTSVEMAWPAFHGLRQTGHAFLLFTQKNCFFIIPKRSFANMAELAQAQRILTEHLRLL